MLSQHRDRAHAVAIGPGPASQSYLVIEKIIAACKGTGAEAVHPGYGFLSERADFARALSAAGIVFIGPRPEAIAAMNGVAARAIVAEIQEQRGIGEDNDDIIFHWPR